MIDGVCQVDCEHRHALRRSEGLLKAHLSGGAQMQGEVT